MTLTVDLNADMGESFGPWTMGDDAALLDIVTSANIACGFHAGDPDVMARTMAGAARRGVGIGAHPGFADLQGFGRRRIHLPADSLANLVRYQVAAAQGMAQAQGLALAHVKLHGALANMASEDVEMARVAYAAAAQVAPGAVMVVLAATAQQRAAEALGLNRLHRFRHVVFPQAFRRILPPLGNDFIAMVKDSSLVSVLGVLDVTQAGKVTAAGNFRYFETYNVVALIYLTMTIGLSLALRRLENHLRAKHPN
jgi:ABC-type arginine transport system permease subunit